MTYKVEYINCKICGADRPGFLGTRGNREYAGAPGSVTDEEHIVTNVVKCKVCGFVYINPLIFPRKTGYDNPHNYISSGIMGPEALCGFTLGLIEKYVKKSKMLDIGCGKGEFLSAAKKRGWEVYGLEPSVNLGRFAIEKSGADVKMSDLKESHYPDNYFDIVTLNMVLEHIDGPKEFILEIRRILKDRGHLFIEVPNMDSLMLKIAALYYRLSGKAWSPFLSPLHYPFHCYGYNMSSLAFLLNNSGFYIKRKVVRDSSMRGFRFDAGGSAFEKAARNAVSKLSGLLGMGDVLNVIAEKKRQKTY